MKESPSELKAEDYRSVKDILHTKGKWVMMVPITGLSFSKSLDGEFRVDKFTFVNAKRLARCRKRLEIPVTTGELFKKQAVASLFEGCEVYAIASAGGEGDKVEEDLTKTLKDELDILALSQLGYSKRRHNAKLSSAFEIFSGSFKRLMMNSTTQEMVTGWQREGKYNTLHIDQRWKDYQRDVFFDKLLSVIRGDCGITDNWIKDIRNAAVLAGQSQSSSDVANAFLWNMIAIETLLTTQGDSYSTVLPKRVEAFIGWSQKWDVDKYHDKIQAVYKKRCGYVHAGRRDTIEISDLLFTDDILWNVMTNVICHIKLFHSKSDLIQFSEKVQAEQKLGIKANVQPRTLTFMSRTYQAADYKKI